MAAKLTYEEYEARGNNFIGAVNDFSTWISPIDNILDWFGIKNPTQEAAEKYFNDSYNAGGAAATKVKFGGWIGTIGEGFPPATAKRIYNSMSPQELITVGHLADSKQKLWLQDRWAAVQRGTVPAMWIDPTVKAGPLSSLGDMEDWDTKTWALVAGAALILFWLLG